MPLVSFLKVTRNNNMYANHTLSKCQGSAATPMYSRLGFGTTQHALFGMSMYQELGTFHHYGRPW